MVVLQTEDGSTTAAAAVARSSLGSRGSRMLLSACPSAQDLVRQSSGQLGDTPGSRPGSRAQQLRVLQRASRKRLDTAATLLGSAFRTHIIRMRFVNILTASIRISSCARGMIVRRHVHHMHDSATTIQTRYRGKCAREETRAYSQWQRTVLSTVQSLIKALDNGDHSAIRTILTHDALVVVDLPSFQHTCRGVQEFLAHPTLSKKQPKVSRTFMPLRIVRPSERSFGDGKGGKAEEDDESTMTLAREVCVGITDTRIEYTVRREEPSRADASGQHPHRASTTERGKTPTKLGRKGSKRYALANGVPRVCRIHSTHRVDPVRGAGGGADGDEAMREATTLNLRDSFATLDSDRSGHLSLGEIADAMQLVGVSSSKEGVQAQLVGLSTDDAGGFLLSELDTVLVRDQAMRNEGIEYDRPLLFDLLPLVAKTVDAHKTVDACLRLARERDAKIVREHTAAMRRLRSVKTVLRSPMAKLAAMGARNEMRRAGMVTAAKAAGRAETPPSRSSTPSMRQQRWPTGHPSQRSTPPTVPHAKTPGAALATSASMPALRGRTDRTALPNLELPPTRLEPSLAHHERRRHARGQVRLHEGSSVVLPRLPPRPPPVPPEEIVLTSAQMRALDKHSRRQHVGRQKLDYSMEARFRARYAA